MAQFTRTCHAEVPDNAGLGLAGWWSEASLSPPWTVATIGIPFGALCLLRAGSRLARNDKGLNEFVWPLVKLHHYFAYRYWSV